jgi:hypothetical protein
MITRKPEHDRLAEEAILYKKAWFFAMAMCGHGTQIDPTERFIPPYRTWTNKNLLNEIKNLSDDFETILNNLFVGRKKSKSQILVSWFAKHFDIWVTQAYEAYSPGRVHEVQDLLGSFKVEGMDIPLYGEVLVQGFMLTAIRHPEYHLASDMELLFTLFMDAEDIANEAYCKGQFALREPSLSLGRSVILTCFNLLESYASGISLDYQLAHKVIPDTNLNLLNGKDDKNRDLPLRKRLELFPELISGNAIPDEIIALIAELFGEYKERRDSFVHCKPGPEQTKWGYVKEERFHDVDEPIVRRTVQLTTEVISQLWLHIHGRSGPSWLPKFNAAGRFDNKPVQLTLRNSD